jgi:hypothetical protein
MNYEREECPKCGRTFTGEHAKLKAEECEANHEIIVFSIMDYELPGFISYFNTHDRRLLPKGFIRKLKNLQGRALRG